MEQQVPNRTLFLLVVDSTEDWEIVSGHYLVWASDEDDAMKKLTVRTDMCHYTVKKVSATEVNALEFKGDVYEINDVIVE